MTKLYRVCEYDPYMPDLLQDTVVKFTTDENFAKSLCKDNNSYFYEGFNIRKDHLKPFQRFLDKYEATGDYAGCLQSVYEDWCVSMEDYM